MDDNMKEKEEASRLSSAQDVVMGEVEEPMNEVKIRPVRGLLDTHFPEVPDV